MTVALEEASREVVPAVRLPEDPFGALREVLVRWFYKPDLRAIRIAMGTIKAHYLGIGAPAWLFVVAPPGAGKTTMTIMGACGLPEVQAIGDVTENTFLSGFHGHKDPGLLEKLGPTTQGGNTYTTTGNTILLVKDSTTVLAMRRDKRSVILSQLREIHDGQFRRDFGTGVTRIWNGRGALWRQSPLCWTVTTPPSPPSANASCNSVGTAPVSRRASGPSTSRGEGSRSKQNFARR